MAEQNQKMQEAQARERQQTEFLPGVKLLRTLEGHDETVRSLAFDPKGEILASGGDDGTVKLWEPGSGKLLRTLQGHRRSIFSVAFDSQGNTLASASADCKVKLWKPRSGKLLRSLDGHEGEVNCLAFSRHDD